jgi:energy-coupling factor transporter ATP-binding protein EcfA2
MPRPLPAGWWGPTWTAATGRSVISLIDDGVLDAELAALLWLLVERRVPIVVAAGPSGVGKSTLLTALLAFLPPEADVRFVLGPDPDLGWLPEAGALGWAVPSDPSSLEPEGPGPADPGRTVLASPELSGHLPWYAWGRLARVLVRAASLGYGLATTVHAERLEDVLEALSRPPVSLSADELGHIGVVVILRAVAPRPGSSLPRRRVTAAHLVRPPSRDAHGHVQRLGPAVLAARDPEHDRLEHYAWGVIPELAARLGRRAGDLERAHARRVGWLRELVAAGRSDEEMLSQALADYRAEHREDPTA